MNDKTRDAFEFGDEPLPVTVTVRGKSRTYLFNDISKNDADTLFAPLAEAGGDHAKTLIANRALTNRVVAVVVTREDGSKIPEADVGEMSAKLVNKLALKALAYLNDADVDAAGEAKAEAKEEPEAPKG